MRPTKVGAFISPFQSPSPWRAFGGVHGAFLRPAPARDRRGGQTLKGACPTGFRRSSPGKSRVSRFSPSHSRTEREHRRSPTLEVLLFLAASTGPILPAGRSFGFARARRWQATGCEVLHVIVGRRRIQTPFHTTDRFQKTHNRVRHREAPEARRTRKLDKRKCYCALK
jgi:hypothetical protein